MTLDLSGLDAGAYILSVQVDERTIVHRLIKD